MAPLKPFFSFSKSFLSIHRSARRKLSAGRHHHRRTTVTVAKPPAPPPGHLHGRTMVVDVDAWLLRSPCATFPYFMLVAIEAGSFVRGLLLLLLYPVLCLLRSDTRTRAMVMVSFFGLRRAEAARISKAVLPKFFLEGAAMEGLEVVRAGKKVVAVSALFPRVMVEGFLREYVAADVVVVGREVKVVSGFYVGVMEEEEVEMERFRALFGEEMEAMRKKGDGVVGLVGGRSKAREHILFSHYCKEMYTVTEGDKKTWHPLPRDRYPKPLVFHDGRVAFAPTPLAALAMYVYLPFGIALAVFRTTAFALLPYRYSVALGALTGVRSRLVAGPRPHAATHDRDAGAPRGRLYVSNHRTLLDPITVAATLDKPVTAVTYSLSRVSELIAPISTARLTRDREEDRRRMEALLARGDLVVCPEGTTCREPYLLRFSPLFAELADEVTPVALDTSVDMFYGTSTKPASKCLDPLYFMMNTRPEYRVEFLEPMLMAPEDGARSTEQAGSIDAANRVQRALGEALGFELTGLTRKDKYMMLAGNEGVVKG